MQKLLAAARAFADPTRVRVIFALRDQELCVCELCDALGLVQSTLSTHLQYLRQTELVDTRNDGKWVYYALAKEFSKMAEWMFGMYGKELRKDRKISRDGVRLRKRLAMRTNDTCCRGFGTDKVPGRGERRGHLRRKSEMMSQ